MTFDQFNIRTSTETGNVFLEFEADGEKYKFFDHRTLDRVKASLYLDDEEYNLFKKAYAKSMAIKHKNPFLVHIPDVDKWTIRQIEAYLKRICSFKVSILDFSEKGLKFRLTFPNGVETDTTVVNVQDIARFLEDCGLSSIDQFNLVNSITTSYSEFLKKTEGVNTDYFPKQYNFKKAFESLSKQKEQGNNMPNQFVTKLEWGKSNDLLVTFAHEGATPRSFMSFADINNYVAGTFNPTYQSQVNAEGIKCFAELMKATYPGVAEVTSWGEIRYKDGTSVGLDPVSPNFARLKTESQTKSMPIGSTTKPSPPKAAQTAEATAEANSINLKELLQRLANKTEESKVSEPATKEAEVTVDPRIKAFEDLGFNKKEIKKILERQGKAEKAKVLEELKAELKDEEALLQEATKRVKAKRKQVKPGMELPKPTAQMGVAGLVVMMMAMFYKMMVMKFKLNQQNQNQQQGYQQQFVHALPAEGGTTASRKKATTTTQKAKAAPQKVKVKVKEAITVAR